MEWEAAAGVLAEVNAVHGRSWRLRHRLSGGHQSGAFLVADDAGPAVLKWADDPNWAPTVMAAGPLVNQLLEQGWPTAAWLVYGHTSDGFPYEVQELIEGSTEERVTLSWLSIVLPQIRAHAGLGRTGMRNWSRYDWEVVFDDRDRCFSDVAGAGDAGASLVATITAITEPYASSAAVGLPDGDLVHGDLSPQNVLVRSGRVAAFIDVEALGRGARAHDLSNLLLYAALWGDPRGVPLLEAEIRDSLTGPGQFEVVISAVTVTLLQFGVQHWPMEDLDLACRLADALLRQLSGNAVQLDCPAGQASSTVDSPATFPPRSLDPGSKIGGYDDP